MDVEPLCGVYQWSALGLEAPYAPWVDNRCQNESIGRYNLCFYHEAAFTASLTAEAPSEPIIETNGEDLPDEQF